LLLEHAILPEVTTCGKSLSPYHRRRSRKQL